MKDTKVAFAQAFASRLATLTNEQQEALTRNSRIDTAQVADRTRSALLSGLDSNESPLQVARQAINARAAVVAQRFSDSIPDPRGYLIELMTSGRLPAELTLAFREGRAFSDEDLRSLIDDLEALNNDPDDEH